MCMFLIVYSSSAIVLWRCRPNFCGPDSSPKEEVTHRKPGQSSLRTLGKSSIPVHNSIEICLAAVAGVSRPPWSGGGIILPHARVAQEMWRSMSPSVSILQNRPSNFSKIKRDMLCRHSLVFVTYKNRSTLFTQQNDTGNRKSICESSSSIMPTF
jgi:hypothetical protein